MSVVWVPMFAAMGVMVAAMVAFTLLFLAALPVAIFSERWSELMGRWSIYCLAVGTYPGGLYLMTAGIIGSIIAASAGGS